MGRNLSPVLGRELTNLDKDADSRSSAMKRLKSYVKELDSKAIPVFLAQVSDTKETGSLPGECMISLYEVVARVHGVKIVPMIDNIMASITKTLASSAVSFPLQQACSKLVPAMARYGIDPTTPEEQKRHVIFLLCNPLSESLMGCQESLSSGAALCLKALVDSDNWRFASNEMVNKVCQNVAVALGKMFSQTNAHMGLVMALAKWNTKILEPYARLLVRSGLHILNSRLAEGSSQNRLSAIHMINILMKFLDLWSLSSELPLIIEAMEKCQSDQMAYVRGAALEALQIAKRIGVEEGSRLDRTPGSVTGLNLSRSEARRGNLWDNFDQTQTPTLASPDLQTVGTFLEYELIVGSPISESRAPLNQFYEHRNASRKLWRYENGGVDIPIKDGLFSELARESANSAKHRLHSENQNRDFEGVSQRKPADKQSRSATTRPLRRGSHLSEDLIFNTPRKLLQSLQDSPKSYCRRRIKSLSSANFEWSPTLTDPNYYGSYVEENGGSNINDEHVRVSSESVASTDDVVVKKQMLEESPTQTLDFQVKKHRKKKAALRLVCAISFLALAALYPLLWINDEKVSFYVVPT